VLRDRAGYHTMVTGRDDLDKSSGGPGIDGMNLAMGRRVIQMPLSIFYMDNH
jgi:hypothetical protein